MSLLKCPKCGEMFSDSYKTCPFCEEDDAYYGGRATKRRRRAETPRRKAPSILGPVVVLVLILLVLLVVWLLFGDQIKTAIGGQKPHLQPDCIFGRIREIYHGFSVIDDYIAADGEAVAHSVLEGGGIPQFLRHRRNALLCGGIKGRRRELRRLLLWTKQYKERCTEQNCEQCA